MDYLKSSEKIDFYVVFIFNMVGFFIISLQKYEIGLILIGYAVMEYVSNLHGRVLSLARTDRIIFVLLVLLSSLNSVFLYFSFYFMYFVCSLFVFMCWMYFISKSKFYN